ncbi:NAD(P)H-dependent oxidoreductase [Sulfitobacter sp. PR48]|jgi:FMN-dependent NADH-azoreductase|uniref:FMN dependent NADH:quinone oxidoreductase n=1 Tax=Sulfitobacter porphyrae TaxID=1246864 RepID=A0ABW2B1B4_9RHOB|nr:MULTISPECIES: NAD(P)H-dependent oxidoreductase [unclassified Sulfitobacter]MCZ4258324.1 NAD(P)H-dependent oxidoreductase [Sulfitobacter sp. G21635-S1]MDD9722223.1 NAD(P)H-dependent oxidoreductase [Sulfitobacter sp. PR48]GLT08966.1 FMN-dependent NADH-azoreductase [Sulfitobacter porphyrae]
MSILRIDSSANTADSVTRKLTDRIVAKLGDSDIVTRDLALEPLPQITHTWAVARATPEADRAPEQVEALKESDKLVAELLAADTIVIGAPVYNFGVPASLKAWIDLVARVGVTFRYTENGPEGLVKGKRVIIAMASGGVPAGSPADFVTEYLKFVLGFLGMTDVTIVAADALAKDAEGTIARANDQVDGLAIAA